MADLFSLEGKFALVTGAAGGLGEWIKHALASKGATVICAARRRERIEAVAANIVVEGGLATALPLNISVLSAFQNALNHIESELGLVDVLVNIAGVSDADSALNASREGWDRTIAVHLTASFELGRFVTQRLAATRPGRIIIRLG